MHVTATVNYHVKRAEPQAFYFDVNGCVGNLVAPELVPTRIRVEDLRFSAASVEFENDGISFEKHTSSVTDFENSSEWQERYNEELRVLLMNKTGAREVTVFDHTLRIDSSNAERKPARNVHNDYSQPGAEQRLIDIVGEKRAHQYQSGHYAFVNIWRPVERPVELSPLGFIRPGSICEEDWMAIQLVYPDRHGQILGVAANDNHDWFYMSRMTQDEVIIFNIYDNQGRPYLGHSALDVEAPPDSQHPRKSIETRTLVRYS